MKIKGLIVLIIIICLILTIKLFPTIKFELLKREYSDIETEEEIMKKLESKTFDELLDEINIFSNNSGDGLIYHSHALIEKSKNVSDERILAEILNKKNSLAARINLIQISPLIDAHLDVNSMQNILFDNNTDFAIKHNALIYLYQSDNLNIELLEKLSSGSDEELAFQANKILKNFNPAN